MIEMTMTLHAQHTRGYASVVRRRRFDRGTRWGSARMLQVRCPVSDAERPSWQIASCARHPAWRPEKQSGSALIKFLTRSRIDQGRSDKRWKEKLGSSN